MTPPVRYRFESFVLSSRQRVLLRGGRPVALIPKYFDLLLLLVRNRQDAVSKQCGVPLEQLADAGHASYVEQPAAVAALLREALAA